MLVLYIFGIVLIVLGGIHLVLPNFLRRVGARQDRAMAETGDRDRYESMNRIRGVVLIVVGIVAVISAMVL